MKRLNIILGCVFLVVMGAIIFLTGKGGDVPRYVPGKPALVPFTWDHYNWGSRTPFAGGKMWMWTAGVKRGDTQCLLYDLDQREILGELHNGGCPALWSPEISVALCGGPDSPGAVLKQHVLELVARIRGGKAKPNRTDSFWFLDLKSNVATPAGSVEQFWGSGSSWNSSPGFRYGYTAPSTGFGQWIALCDLQDKTFRKISLNGWTKGWWSDHEVLAEVSNNTFDAFDVITQKSRRLFGPADVAKCLADAGLTNPSVELEAMSVWNGKEYDFYFGPKKDLYGLGATNIFVLKAEKSKPALKVAYRNFRPQWSGHFDEAGTRYIYGGEAGGPGKGGDGSLYLRDLTNHTTVTLVPPDNTRQYTIPMFYGDDVIYFRNRLMRRISANGSNDVAFLPSPAVK